MPQNYDGDRIDEMRAWLTANNIVPKTVTRDGDLTIKTKDDGSRVIAYESFALTDDGHVQVDERRKKAAVNRCESPLLVEPPAWWEPYENPTRDDLLEGEQPYTDDRVIPTPAQWIWLWNRLTPAERLSRAQRVLEDREAALQCSEKKHEEQIRRLEAQVAGVSALAERWRHTGDRKNGPLRELLQALSA
jgi:hypothetical protein